MTEDSTRQLRLEIDLREFEKLRDEIDNRTDLSKDILLAELTVLAAGLTLAEKIPDVLGAVAAVSSFLWLFWLDHTEQIYKIAAYLGTNLRPRVHAIHPDGLQWENFMRVLDQGGRPAALILFGHADKVPDVVLRKTRNIGTYVMLLFVATAPVLIVAYFGQVLLRPLQGLYEHWVLGRPRPFDALGAVRWLWTALVALLWVYGLLQYVRFRASVRTIDKALLAAAGVPGGDRPADPGPVEPSGA